MVKRRRKNSGMLMWGSVGVVVVVVGAIVLLTTLSSSGAQLTYFGPTSPTILNEVQNVPASVFNAVGVSSPVIQVAPLTVETKKQPPLYITVGTKRVPGIFYFGAEFCPYCAATRWGIITALSRFGHFTSLYDMLSSATDPAGPNIATFSFVGKKPTDVVTYTSKYFAFQPFEVLDRNGKALQKVTPQFAPLLTTYNSGLTFPFMSINNHVLISGSEFDPLALSGISRTSIAAGLTDPTIPTTQAIIATANYVSAGICAMTGSQPGTVCHSSGVKAAAVVLHLKL